MTVLTEPETSMSVTGPSAEASARYAEIDALSDEPRDLLLGVLEDANAGSILFDLRRGYVYRTSAMPERALTSVEVAALVELTDDRLVEINDGVTATDLGRAVLRLSGLYLDGSEHTRQSGPAPTVRFRDFTVARDEDGDLYVDLDPTPVRVTYVDHGEHPGFVVDGDPDARMDADTFAAVLSAGAAVLVASGQRVHELPRQVGGVA